MIRDADVTGKASGTAERAGRATMECAAGSDTGRVPPALMGTSAADRFCAWNGRSPRRLIFSVFPLGPHIDIDDLPLDAGAVVLGIRRTIEGVRRVLWACAVDAMRRPAGLAEALVALAAEDGGECHLHLLAVSDEARERIIADLGFPLLAMRKASDTTPWPQIAAMALGVSMNPPDWRRQRSA